MKDVRLTVLSNKKITDTIYQMRLTGDLSEIKNSGEFVNIKVPDFYLRRPFSVYDFGKDYVDVLYKVLGQGTLEMTRIEEGYKLDTLVGLGNGFDVTKAKKPLLVAGGIGIAPMYNLAKKFNELGIKPTLIYGARNKDEIVFVDEFEKLCDVVVCTDDGSLGFKGTVVFYLEKNKVDYDYYYSCGPYRMLEALASYSKKGCVSLEARMGCGFGACMGCSIKTTNGSKRVCKEGPVFEASEVIF